jgi:hypothetical protein
MKRQHSSALDGFVAARTVHLIVQAFDVFVNLKMLLQLRLHKKKI